MFCFGKALLPSLVAGSLICFGDAAVKAAVIINAVQSGSDVIFSYTGQLNLTGLGGPAPGFLGDASIIEPSSGTFVAAGTFDIYQLSDSFTFTPFGAGGSKTLENASVGSGFAMVDVLSQLWVPFGYTSNASLSGSVTFAGESFSSLGLTPGSYTTTLPSDSITMKISAVPAPLPLLGLGAAAAFFRRLKRRIALRRKREEVGAAV